MIGKTLKMVNNDLSGVSDTRYINVFCCFRDMKYGNEYLIFCYFGEYANNVLYCGSVHFKDNSLVVFSIKKENEKIVLDFINRLLSNSYSSMYQILDIRNMLKLEIVSSNSLEMDHTVIEKLDVLSIPNKKEEELAKEREKKPIFLYVLLVLLIILFLGALYFYFNMDKYEKKAIVLNCTTNLYNEDIDVWYTSDMVINFELDDVTVKNIMEVNTYNFTMDEYNAIVNYEDIEELFMGYTITNDKDNYRLILKRDISTIINTYREIREFYEKKGYVCQEGKI